MAILPLTCLHMQARGKMHNIDGKMEDIKEQ